MVSIFGGFLFRQVKYMWTENTHMYCTTHFCFKAATGYNEVSGTGKNYF